MNPVLETALSEGFKGVNDLVFSSCGDVYFTDQGQTGLQDPSGRVYRYSAAGDLARLIDTVPSPNGIALSADGKVLFVAATRANQIWRLPLHPSGATTKVGIFAHLHGGPSGPDGLALDEEGCLLIVHASFGSVWRCRRSRSRSTGSFPAPAGRPPISHLAAPTDGACTSPRPKPGAFFGLSYRFPASCCTLIRIERGGGT